jgi:hypothetical protein
MSLTLSPTTLKLRDIIAAAIRSLLSSFSPDYAQKKVPRPDHSGSILGPGWPEVICSGIQIPRIISVAIESTAGQGRLVTRERTHHLLPGPTSKCFAAYFRSMMVLTKENMPRPR